jgi:hypothetical protein
VLKLSEELAPLRPVTDLLETVLRVATARRRRVWLVGGIVRDVLRGRSVTDLDFITSGRGLSDFLRHLAREVRAARVPLDETLPTIRLVPRGRGCYLDFSAIQGDKLADDLYRRDFTINALALDLAALEGDRPEFIDLYGGRKDLGDGLIRMVHPGVFADDPLRLLRAVRFRALYDYTIEPATRQQMGQEAEGLRRISAERNRVELLRTFSTNHSGRALRELAELGLLGPALQLSEPVTGENVEAAVRGAELLDKDYPAIRRVFPWNELPDGPPVEGSLLGATRFLVVTALTLGCLRRRLPGEGRSEQVMLRYAIDQLRFSRQEALLLAQLVPEAAPKTLLSAEPPPDKNWLDRWFWRWGDRGPLKALVTVLLDDGWSEEQREAFLATVAEAWEIRYRGKLREPTPVGGGELVGTLGIPRSPVVGVLVRELHFRAFCGEVTNREEALCTARQLLPEITAARLPARPICGGVVFKDLLVDRVHD